MNRTAERTVGRLTLMTVAIAGLIAGRSPVATAAEHEPPAAPPAEILKLFADLAGTWAAREVTARMGPESMKGTSKVSCDKAVAGWALRCQVTIQLGKQSIEEADLFGWDRRTGELTMFAVNSMGEAHEHRGKLDGTTIRLEHRGTRHGKPYREEFSLALAGKELRWQTTSTSGGQVVFEGEGTYRK